ncbi:MULTISPECIES: DUF4245 family protein [Dermabacter]|uniref:DUF4245 family protein n=1 Tax=unclassified Dermabacter TaxID=2635686 RepID=UPI0008A26FEC|nr:MULTISPECIES: DUF4245 family protein [unclassified Dermabacter]MDU4923375.1 DUF4245 family protein [Dermabacter sp.]OFT19994.1 hypothetical protein HMPREF3176_09450 [Dermabacter sp. HMSC08H10]
MAESHERPQRKKRELPTKKNTSVRNLVWAIGLNLIVVAIAAVVIVGLGRNDRDTASSARSHVNVSESAARASESLGFRAADVEPEGFTVREAKMSTTEPAYWEVRYTSPSGELETLLQARADFSALSPRVRGKVTQADYFEIRGTECANLEIQSPSSDANADAAKPVSGIECSARETTLIVYGAGDGAEHTKLMQAALDRVNQ